MKDVGLLSLRGAEHGGVCSDLVHRHWEVVDIERAVRGLRHGLLLVTVGSQSMVLRFP